MSATVDFYLSRAAESAKAAQETKLENVRERSLRAEAAWLVMANRLIDTEDKKKRDAQDKAARAPQAANDVPWPVSAQPRQTVRSD